MKIGAIFLPALLSLILTGCGKSAEYVKMDTRYGSVILEINLEKAPITAGNFIQNVEGGAFDGALFYRSVQPGNQPLNEYKIQVLQGGLYQDSIIERYSTIVHETTLQTGILHKKGVISMARNEPGTASTEFFICMRDEPELDMGGGRNPDGQGFAAFGTVIQGFETLEQIYALSAPEQYINPPVVIQNIQLLERQDARYP